MLKFWEGKLPLGQMFWIWFLAVPVVLRLILLIGGFTTIADSVGKGSLFIILFGAFMLAYYVFAFVGTWRSASRYSESRNGVMGGLLGKAGFDWGIAAKLAMIVILATSGLTLI